VPSGNSTAAAVLLRLSKLLDNRHHFRRAEDLLGSMACRLRNQPRAHLSLLCAADCLLHPPCEIVIAGRREGDDTRKLLGIVHRKFIPDKILALAETETDSGPVEPVVPLLAGKQMLSGKAAAYVCKNSTCAQPVTDAASLEKVLENLRKLP
jgi:uncharacterized protein YyaL (SSP411 family)